MPDRVSREPMGVGEQLLLQDSENMFAGWKRVTYEITPASAWSALAHLEASGFNRPGDAPVLWALSQSDIPAGTETASQIYARAYEASGQAGNSWDVTKTSSPLDVRTGLGFLTGQEQVLPTYEQYVAEMEARGANPAPEDFLIQSGVVRPQTAPEDKFSLFGTIKGASRWLFAALDIIPEGYDAVARAATLVKSGDLTFGEALGGIFGGEHSQEVGIPFFSYLNSAMAGERLNMGTGWFAEGQVSEDIQYQMYLYDITTNGEPDDRGVTHGGLTQTDFERESAKSEQRGDGPGIIVLGLDGKGYRANNLDEWKFLRNNVGRAALLQSLIPNSASQQALGIPHGSFQEQIFDEATVARQPKTGRYFVVGSGSTLAAGMGIAPETGLYNAVSGTLDFGKQLIDLPVTGLGRGASHLIGKAGRFIGLSDETASLVRGTSVVNDIIKGADLEAVPNVLDDVFRGQIDPHRAANALARQADEQLDAANKTVGALRKHGAAQSAARREEEIAQMVREGVAPEKAANIAKGQLSSYQLDQLIRRAANGDVAARSWAEGVLNGTSKNLPDSTVALDNLASVTSRSDEVDLVAGRFGEAQVADEIWNDANARVSELNDVLTNQKGWAIPDPTKRNPNRVTLTFDADLGRASKTLDDLRKSLPDGQHQGLVNRLINIENNWLTRRWAEKALGDTDEAATQVDNLARVLKRMDGDQMLTKGASAVKPHISPDMVSSLLTGGGKADDLIEALTAATDHRAVKAILQPTIEFSGKIPPPLIDALAEATTRGEVVDVFMKLAAGQPILPQKMALLGNAAKGASISTVVGMSAGALAGAEEGYQQEGVAGAIGGALGGGVLGALGGSVLGSPVGYLFGTSTRKIEDVADAMDLLLAGTRATTSDLLRLRGIDVGRAQAGLSAPSLLSYGFGHSALGRRIMRSAATNMNLTDPTDIYYKLADYTQSLGMTIDDKIQVMVKKVSEGDDLVEKVVRSSFKGAGGEIDWANEISRLIKEGYEPAEYLKMNDVFHQAANLTPNNPAAAYPMLHTWGDIVDASLADRGLPDEFRHLITHFTKESETTFLGSLDAIGQPASHMQYVVNGSVHQGDLGARLESELWSGHIELPSPNQVQRAVNQLDRLGRTTQLFTGKGVLKQFNKNVLNVATGSKWVKITPELERNVAMRTARAVSQGLWAPVVLLGRPFAFLSRVLGEDQARMAAASLPNMFTHPISYVSYVSANLGFFRRHGLLKGVAARSIVPDDIIKGGEVVTDILDNMSNWDLAEDARHALNIYDRRLAKERERIFGQHVWTSTERGSQLYLDYLTGEMRQLVSDPMVRHMARSSADDAVSDTYRWLTETSQGRKVLDDWGRQFKSQEQAAEFMDEANLKAFLHDQYARLHLKTGGDYVFKWGDSYKTGYGDVDPELARRRGWDRLDDGYTIFRKGDDELLDMVGTGRMKNVKLVGEDGIEYFEDSLRIKDNLTDAKWDAFKGRIRDKHRSWENIARGPNYDPLTSMRFPKTVKGSRAETLSLAEKAKVWDYWEKGIDRFYDWILGRPSRVFSRQPVFGHHYWDRVGMLYPSMSEDMKKVYQAIAEKEGVWRYVQKISGAAEGAGLKGTGLLDNVRDIDLNAKAYSVERVRDILFDLHRERNYIDGLRIIAPFAAPFNEAMEAWGRVIREQPFTVWRRGGQIVQNLWNTTGIGDQADPFGQGWFYVDPKTGDEMFEYPWIGRAIPSWLNKGVGPDQTPDALTGRARGLNIVFGTQDLTQGEGPEFMGFPIAAGNPGTGPVLQLATAPFLKDKEGILKVVYDEMFPYGIPNNPLELLPYNLRKLAEGRLGQDSQLELVRHTTEQFGQMVANGEIGQGPQYTFDISNEGGVKAAQAAAQERAINANWFESLARTILPTLTTPESLVAIQDVPGLDSERFITLGALADEARSLMSEDGAQWFFTPDGYRLSTEGDWEITTEYLNREYGMDMFSAEFLSLPLSDRPYPMVYTNEGISWMRGHEGLLGDHPASGSLLMPNFANLKESEAIEPKKGEPNDLGYNYEAFQLAVDLGLGTWFNYDDHTAQIQSRLLKMANREVDVMAIENFGEDSQLSDEQKLRKRAWINTNKDMNAARYKGGSIDEGQKTLVLDELRGWRDVPWDNYDLTPQERATVDAVNWYWNVIAQANDTALPYGIYDITLKGQGEEEQRIAAAFRSDVVQIVHAQMAYADQNGFDMGNFAYIWEQFLSTEMEDDPREGFDQLQDLASIQNLDLEQYLTPVGGS